MKYLSVDRRYIVFPVIILSLLLPAVTVAEELLPIWSMIIVNGQPKIITNEFSGEKTFPLEVLMINEVRYFDGEPRKTKQRFVGPLWFNEKGYPIDELYFYPVQLVSSGAHETKPSVLDVGSVVISPNHHKIGGVTKLATERLDDEISGWEKSPDNDFVVLHKGPATFFVDMKTGTFLKNYPFLTYDVAFASRAELVAAGVKEDKNSFMGDPQSWIPFNSKIIIVDFMGEIVTDLPFSSCYVDQLYLDPEGRSLIYTKYLNRKSNEVDEYEIMHLDVESGENTLMIKRGAGFRYHSADGKYMALVRGGYGEVLYYDMTSPTCPILLWRYQEDDQIVSSTAVNEDGSLVAFRIGKAGEASDRCLYVLDKNQQQVAKARIKNNVLGLFFVDGYLISGTQPHPLPAYIRWQDTDEINIYDLN